MSNVKNIKTLIKFMLPSFLKKKDDYMVVDKVHTISFRVFSPEGGKGGGAAVQSCQNIILGNKYKNLELKYTYFEENEFSKDWKSGLSDLWGGAFFAIIKTKNENNSVYITHDYGTGFGLALLKKRFVYISHLQGPRVEEKINFNEPLNKVQKMIINFCERFVFKNAMYVCFPSNGAKDHYFISKYRSIDKGLSSIGPILYNTIYTDPSLIKINGIEKDTDYITILSTGALTHAKGIDRISSFLEKLIPISNKKIRWIVVGNGYLKKEVEDQGIILEKKFDSFKFIFKESCSYPEVRYLVNISDIYLMMHRVSIFDLATLEAMKEGLCIALSKVSGNVDFNQNENIIFIEDDIESAKNLAETNLITNGILNKNTYDSYFSNEKFSQSYKNVIDDLCR